MGAVLRKAKERESVILRGGGLKKDVEFKAPMSKL